MLFYKTERSNVNTQNEKEEDVMIKKSRQGGSPMFLIIGIIFLLISIGLGVCLVIQQCEYDRQVDAVVDIKDLVVSTLPSESNDTAPPETNVMGGSEQIPEETEPDRIYIDANFLRVFDFEQLQAINTDASRWVYIPDTPIDAYVLQEQTVGEYYYLYKDIYREYSSIGSFLTPKIPMDADDAHLLIFGHTFSANKDLAFGSLKIHYADAAIAEMHPYVYVYYPDRVERWQVWAACDAHAYDAVYDLPYAIGSGEYADMISDMEVKSRYQLCDKPDRWTQTLFLSTCNGRRGGSNVRLVIACVPDIVYYYDTKSVESFGHETIGSVGGIHGN